MALGMSVRRAQREIDSDEFRYWVAYARLHPFGGELAEIQKAHIMSLIGNIHRREGAKAFTVGDFIIPYGEEPKRQTDEEMKTMLTQWALSEQKADAKNQRRMKKGKGHGRPG